MSGLRRRTCMKGPLPLGTTRNRIPRYGSIRGIDWGGAIPSLSVQIYARFSLGKAIACGGTRPRDLRGIEVGGFAEACRGPGGWGGATDPFSNCTRSRGETWEGNVPPVDTGIPLQSQLCCQRGTWGGVNCRQKGMQLCWGGVKGRPLAAHETRAVKFCSKDTRPPSVPLVEKGGD